MTTEPMTMLERVARVILACNPAGEMDFRELLHSIGVDEDVVVDLLATNLARAAIEAMRELSDSVASPVADHMAGNELHYRADEETVRDVWNAVIDTALGEIG